MHMCVGQGSAGLPICSLMSHVSLPEASSYLGHPETHFLGCRHSLQRAGWMPPAASTHYITWHWAGVKGAGRSFILCLRREPSPSHIEGYQPFSFVFPNCTDRVQHPFSWPTGSERNGHGWKVGAWEELGLWRVSDAVTVCLSALESSHLPTCLHMLRALKCYDGRQLICLVDFSCTGLTA